MGDWVVIKVTIPSTLKDRLQEIIKKRGYRTVSEYIRDLIRKDLGEE